MNVSVDGAFVYFTIPILGGIPITQTTVSSFLVTVLLITASIQLGKNLKKRPTGIQVLVEKGVIAYCSVNLKEKAEEAFVSILEKAGFVSKLEESKIDAASALHGCGPAFVYLFIEALADGAVSCGLPVMRWLLPWVQNPTGCSSPPAVPKRTTGPFSAPSSVSANGASISSPPLSSITRFCMP